MGVGLCVDVAEARLAEGVLAGEGLAVELVVLAVDVGVLDADVGVLDADVGVLDADVGVLDVAGAAALGAAEAGRDVVGAVAGLEK